MCTFSVRISVKCINVLGKNGFPLNVGNLCSERSRSVAALIWIWSLCNETNSKSKKPREGISIFYIYLYTVPNKFAVYETWWDGPNHYHHIRFNEPQIHKMKNIDTLQKLFIFYLFFYNTLKMKRKCQKTGCSFRPHSLAFHPWDISVSFFGWVDFFDHLCHFGFTAKTC